MNSEFLDVSNLRPEYNIYKAVYALAHALDDLLKCHQGRGPFPGNSCAVLKTLEPWQVCMLHFYFNFPYQIQRSISVLIHIYWPLFFVFIFIQLVHYLQHVNFTTTFGDPVSFDENGNALPIYDIVNWVWQADGKTRVQNVGDVKRSLKGDELTINEDQIFWNFKSKKVNPGFLSGYLLTVFCFYKRC